MLLVVDVQPPTCAFAWNARAPAPFSIQESDGSSRIAIIRANGW